MHRTIRWWMGLGVVLWAPLAVAQSIVEVIVDGGNDYPWERIELPGTVCSDGSQYKFFVYDNPASSDLVLYFEGGGACWDYESCSGALGVLGAANPNGIADDYITQFKAKYVSPIVNGADPGIPLRAKRDLVTKGWDMVFMPYCTGDVHVGNSVQTYVDPTGQNPPITFRHAGFHNSREAAAWLAGRFPNVNRMLVSGFSAGGVASAAGYYEARTVIDPASSFLLNDSGPLFPAPNSSFNSRPLHDTISAAWDIDTVLSELPASFDLNDYGSITDMLATEFPGDQLAYTGYWQDYNFSRFSYERFYPDNSQSAVLARWEEDVENLIDEMNDHPNFSYHIPWERVINDSHCSSIITFIGSHSCPNIRKKRWWEFWEWPWSQSWKCPGGVSQYGLEVFLDQWVGNGAVKRWVEPPNGFNDEDPGMQIVGPLINDVLAGE